MICFWPITSDLVCVYICLLLLGPHFCQNVSMLLSLPWPIWWICSSNNLLGLYTQNTLGSSWIYIPVSYHSCIRIRPLCASTLWPDGLIRFRIRWMYRVPHVDAQYYQILCTCSSSNWYRRLGRWSLLSRCNLFRNMRTLMAVRNNTRVLFRRIWQLRLLSIMSQHGDHTTCGTTGMYTIRNFREPEVGEDKWSDW